jgi:formamidopyrimidine-DNA glycosylase
MDFVPPDGVSVHLARLGPEPLEDAFDVAAFAARLRSTTRAVKVAIMDPALVVGVGNIYASEALFRAGVRPSRAGNRLKPAEIARLHHEIRELLREAIEAGGSSISDYVQADGANGRFQDRFRVYDREGQPCGVCGGKVRRSVQGGRSTFFCPRCQPR